MEVLRKSKHERFAQAIAAGDSPKQAYTTAYGSAKGADQSACRLLKNAEISRRIGKCFLELVECFFLVPVVFTGVRFFKKR